MRRCARSIRKLIYCSITGYGQTGPRAGEAGHDLNYIGHTGLLALNPGPPDRPVVPPALIADIAGGTLAGGDEHPARPCASATRAGRAAISTSP